MWVLDDFNPCGLWPLAMETWKHETYKSYDNKVRAVKLLLPNGATKIRPVIKLSKVFLENQSKDFMQSQKLISRPPF